MELNHGIEENLRFLIVEVGKQLDKTESLLASSSLSGGQSVVTKDDYVDNLKTFIQRKCFSQATQVGPEESMVDLLKAIDVIAVNLERISDFCENIASQATFIRRPELIDEFEFGPLFRQVHVGVDLIDDALFGRNAQQSLAICRTEQELDDMYAEAFQRILSKLGEGRDAQGYVTVLFIYRYLERMGDSLLNIGEAILSAMLGERIKIDQLRALETSLESADLETALSGFELEAVKETRSGSRISRVRRSNDPDGSRLVIFKDGRMEKLLDERDSVETWNRVMPGLVPQIFSFHHRGDYGSILFEYLEGTSFEDLLLGRNAREIAEALRAIKDVLLEVWSRTREETPVAPRFVDQMSRRLREVYAVHPDFKNGRQQIGHVTFLPMSDLLERGHALDERLQCPFSVFIHGDFNVDNILCKVEEQRVHFIDLHRSVMSDYLQDVSVFLVSIHRLQVFERPVRRLINETMLHFYRFARDFASRNGDTTFGVRLALGLARSFATSTRFVLDHEFSRAMFQRAQYLLDTVLRLDESEVASFQLPEEVLRD